MIDHLHRIPSRRRFLALGGALLALSPGPATAATGEGGAGSPLPVPQHHVTAGPKTVALTFDDGPSPLYTPRVLAVLARYGVPATFFLIGRNVVKYPDVAREILDQGHELGNHSWSHPDLTRLTRDRVRDEIRRTQDVIGDTTGRTPRVFRAPYGFFAPASLAVCARLRLRPVSWSVDTVDWSNPGVEHIVRTVETEAVTGSIVLHHDGTLSEGALPDREGNADRTQTVDALGFYLPRLIDAGYRFTTVSGTGPSAASFG
ncbi:polysaccharide deacetylase family protein [Streptomyces sp. CA-181903]|uniref:polysaccharide deacetylase family protein n=1 Tax=Streptomyces sp. CA-181903 TaxID=3240055 RepID=UPI003D94917C